MLKRLTIRALVLSVAVAGLPALASAAELPPIKVTDANPVMSCATPGRLMAYLKANNPNMPDKFDAVATEYMRHGEALAIRWDYAFFQMLVETGFLKFTGDVNVKQNNFAGLGATGNGANGESFPDVSTGVKAHIEHIAMYIGIPLDAPVAQRTRDVQAWGVLTKWQQSIKRPMTFKDLASKWAPTSKGYPRDIVFVAERFEKGQCQQDDPQPELVADARGGQEPTATGKTAMKITDKKNKPAPAADDARDAPPAATAPEIQSPKAPKASVTANATGGPPASASNQDVRVLNQPAATPADDATPAPTTAPPAAAASETKKSTAGPATNKNAKAEASAPPADAKKTEAPDKKMEMAAVSPGAGPAAASGCKVWQASYGGSKAIIIKATSDKMTNYTVLDVNDGSEKREADAYIAAYAKGGATVGEFTSSAQALEKAFQLCPEG